MKVIHLISGGDTGGAKTHVHLLLYNLNKTIDATLVCFMRGVFSEEAIQMGIPTIILDSKNVIKTILQLRNLVLEGEYDLVHCHGSRGNLMGAILKLFIDIPVITTVHSDYRLDYMGRPLAKLVYGTLNAISLRILDYRIGVSGSMRQLLISRGFRPSHLFTIYNGLDFSRKPKACDRREFYKRVGLQADGDSIVAGIAARLDPVKDVATLMRAFALAREKCPNLRLIIAGDGGEMAALHRLAKELKVQDYVCFTGWLSDMDEFYSSIDINTLTSISETFPFALTEGAIFRLPTISSRVGGVPELIKDGVTGLLFRPGDSKALAAHLRALAKDAGLRRKLGDALHQYASMEYSAEASCRRQIEIYNTIFRRAKLMPPARSGVLICGAYGHGNAGDDAILEAIVGEMRSIDPDMPLTILSRRPRETMRRYGEDSVYTFNFPKFLRVMNHTRLYLNGGGSLIQDVTSRRSLWYYLFTIYQAKKRGNKVIMYGCGIGPVLYGYDQRLVRRVLNKNVDIITLREKHSLQELSRFGVTEPEIVLSSDPALSLPSATDDEIDEALSLHGIDPRGKYICFTLRKWPGFIEKAPCFAAGARHAHEKHGLIPIFLSINHRSDGDAAGCVTKLLDMPFHCLPDPMESGLTIGIMSRMTAVVSMRLHGLIFAAGRGVPLVGISYDPKVTAFLDYIGQDLHVRLEDLQSDQLCSMIDAAIQLAKDKKSLAEKVTKLINIESRNVECARRLLEG
ncbi:MAG TPA: polysaccharide pyruvyl transferase CsaB [Clostridiales bacterium]|nr:polysaccharide pyruvyl transferase CsaB [Clostridiales bacterium]